MADRAIKSERMVNLTVHLPTPGIAGIHATSHSWPGRRPGWTFDANGDKTTVRRPRRRRLGARSGSRRAA